MKYYKYKWNESRGDRFDSWGHSLWYIEVGEDNYPSRQIEIYDNGKILKYSNQYLKDEFGGLSHEKHDFTESDLEELKLGKCTKVEFENNWNR